MKSNRLSIKSVIILFAIFLSSCTRPLSDEHYLRADECDGLGRYCFELAMDDEAYSYDLQFLLFFSLIKTQTDFGDAQMLVEFTSPSASRFEQLYTLEGNYDVQDGFFSKTCLFDYGRDLRPLEYGTWSIKLTLPQELCNQQRLDGVGIRLIRNGTR